ncbi:MAG: sugar ABC transporter permease [Oscillospiraceae bacterium]|jgi:multiple sugar transport system permease protein|nr:sugar ABC transporter permease [Oscillospiraceae bacterium]
MNNRTLRLRFISLGLPALAGFVLLYLYPFIRSLWYSMLDRTREEFVFIDNYFELFQNRHYVHGLRNTFTFSMIGVICLVTLSVLLSFGLLRLGKRLAFIRHLLVMPMILPTVSAVFAWRLVFDNGILEVLTVYYEFAYGPHIALVNADMHDFWIILPLYLIYIWKNIGINIIILSAAMASIPPEVREAAEIDGARGFRLHRRVTLPLISPALVFVTVLSFVNALKIFRESYLFFGGTDYPPDIAYTVQYFMNNMFRFGNYPHLSAASTIFTVIVVMFLVVVYIWESKYNDKIY